MKSHANPAALKDKTIVVYGYGSQGRAHARNLHDSGFTVVVAARPGPSFEQARADGLAVDTPERAFPVADLIAHLVVTLPERSEPLPLPLAASRRPPITVL